MELPENLKTLYRHWRFHTSSSKHSYGNDKIPQEIRWFINERIHIWEKKISGAKPPYTSDPVLSRYRFCNIFRELDKQTIQFHKLLRPLQNNFPLWLLNMFYCRMVARPETVSRVGLLIFDEQKNEILYKNLITSPRPRFGTPYVFPVSVILKSKTPTRELFITQYLPNIMNRVAKEIERWDRKSVYDGVQTIIPIFGYNLLFLWTEVLIDVAYQFPQQLDLFSRFPIGPGALTTFKKLDGQKDPSLLVEELASLGIATKITYEDKPIRLSAENWEGIGCEFRKYTNLKQGKGRKRLYDPDPCA
ncbi:putative DNA base hypermodification protein [Patescibacteria group bacterium AH-259-L07]|nr:putative DNA base hypermodification protein [Patescibacteria group bacterium AH-259-L07]